MKSTQLMTTLAITAIALSTQSARASRDAADFNGDGFGDLAIGVPGEARNGRAGAGLVHVLYGSGDRFTASNGVIWDQDRPGIADSVQTGDRFGASLAWGDFNGDSFDDLAIGIPAEEVDGRSAAGAVSILYGSAVGLAADANQIWHQNSLGIGDSANALDYFGYALATGDFDGDGFYDLAIGAPGEDFNGLNAAGVVHVFYGSAAGLSATDSQLWDQDAAGLEEASENLDQFGYVLAAGDINGDGADDLAIGVPFENHEGKIDAGVVHVVYGSIDGLTAVDAHLLKQDDSSPIEQPGAHDQFGSALSISDFNGDGYADLAVGVIREDVGTIQDAGAVEVFYGHDGGIEDGTEQLWTQNTSGIADIAQTGDYFGAALAGGDFNGDGFDDLAIGVPQEDIANILSAGAVHVIFGSAAGLTSSGDQFLYQDSDGVPDTASTDDRFGATLTAGDFDGDGFADLVVGIPYEGLRGFSSAGAIDVVFCSATGLLSAEHQLWHQDKVEMPETCASNDLFGGSLGAACYNTHGVQP